MCLLQVTGRPSAASEAGDLTRLCNHKRKASLASNSGSGGGPGQGQGPGDQGAPAGQGVPAGQNVGHGVPAGQDASAGQNAPAGQGVPSQGQSVFLGLPAGQGLGVPAGSGSTTTASCEDVLQDDNKKNGKSCNSDSLYHENIIQQGCK